MCTAEPLNLLYAERSQKLTVWKGIGQRLKSFWLMTSAVLHAGCVLKFKEVCK